MNAVARFPFGVRVEEVQRRAPHPLPHVQSQRRRHQNISLACSGRGPQRTLPAQSRRHHLIDKYRAAVTSGILPSPFYRLFWDSFGDSFFIGILQRLPDYYEF